MNGATGTLLDGLAREQARAGGRLPDLPGLRERRARALERLRAHGLPDTRQEAWKYTDLEVLGAHRFRFADAPGGDGIDALLAARPRLGAQRVVFVDGWLDAARSELRALPPGVTLRGIGERPAAGDPARIADGLLWLNESFVGAGAWLDIAAGAQLDAPIELLFLRSAGADPAMCHPRLYLDCGADARARIVETYAGAGELPCLTNAVTEIALARGAHLAHDRIQAEGGAAFHIGRSLVRLEHGADYQATVVAAGARLARHDLDVLLAAEQAACTVLGLYLGEGNRHLDHHLNIEHAAPRTRSDTLFKGILQGASRAVFNGRILVCQDAQRIAAQLNNRNLLLSRRAEVDTKPELEIYADDVQCSHGATVGQLDANALFYLRARGIPEAVARGMLTAAFVQDLVGRVTLPALRAVLQDLAGIPATDPGGQSA